MLGVRTILGNSPQGVVAVCNPSRGLATLKDISIRLKSVKNIQKITKSMKMVAAAKYARSERELRAARPYGEAAQAFYNRVELTDSEKKPSHLILAMTSDRGLCGGVHSSISKTIRNDMHAKPADRNVRIICIGDKSKAVLQRLFSKDILMSANELGKRPPSFEDASTIAQAVLKSGYEFQSGELYYNKFKTVVSYTTSKLPFFSVKAIAEADKLSKYDSLDAEVLQSYMEFSMASMLYYVLKEGNTSEQSSRMTAMEGASKNAGEMIEKLTLHYNRTRQAVITRELIEIISGASAL